MVVDATLYHGVDLQPLKARSLGGANALEHLADRTPAACHVLEHHIVEAVEADRDSTQTCPGQCFNLPWQQHGVGRHRQVFDTGNGCQARHQGGQPGAQQGLATRQAHLVHAEVHERSNQGLDLVVAQQPGSRQKDTLPVQGFLRHAVGAAKIAAVQDGQAQILQRTRMAIPDRRIRPLTGPFCAGLV